MRNALRMWKGDILFLQETKMEVINRSVVRSLWGSQFVDGDFLDVEGYSSGVLLLWDKRVVQKIDVAKGLVKDENKII